MNDPATLALPGLEVAWATDVGRVRASNEDACAVVPLPGGEGLLAVVCDGMGGHAAGEVASGIVCERLTQAAADLRPGLPRLTWFDSLLQAMLDADRLVRERADAEPALHGMGSTAVVAALLPQTALHLHVGDSRLYHFRQGQRLYRTQDHSVVEVLRRVGQLTEEEMLTHPSRNMITAALGGRQSRQLDVAPKWQEGAGDEEQEALLSLQPGDLVLLCSDGLNGMIGEEALAQIVGGHGSGPAAELVERLIQAALEAGGTDNVTVVAAAIRDR